MRAIYLSCILVLFSATGSFASMATFKEVSPDGVFPLSVEFTEIPVDVRSKVEVSFDFSELAQEIVPSSGTSLLTLNNEFKKTNQLLDRVNKDIGDYISVVVPLRNKILAGDSSEKLTEELRKRVRAHYSLVIELKKYARAYLSDVEVESIEGDPVTRIDKYVGVVASRISEMRKTLDSETKAILSDRKVAVSVWCAHKRPGKQSENIHLENYDDYLSGQREPVQNISFLQTPDEQRELLASRQYNQQLLATAKDISLQIRKLDADKQNLMLQLNASLDKLREFSKFIEVSESLDGRLVQLGKISVQDKKLVAEVENLKSSFSVYASLAGDIRKALDAYEIKAKTGDTTGAISGLLVFWEQKAVSLRKYPESDNIDRIIKAIQIELESTLSQGEESLRNDIKADLLEIQNKVLPMAAEMRTGLVAIGASFANIRDGLGQVTAFLNIAQSVNSQVEPNVDKPVGSYSLEAHTAKDTSIEMNNTAWGEDDTYTLYVQVSDSERILKKETYTFRTKKYGWYNKWGEGLAFAKGGWNTTFQPSACGTWTLHKRTRPIYRDGKMLAGHNMLGDVLNFGIGLDSMLFSTERDVEVGLGVDLSFFNGILHLGSGYNFQQSSKPVYFFISASFFNLSGKQSAPSQGN